MWYTISFYRDNDLIHTYNEFEDSPGAATTVAMHKFRQQYGLNYPFTKIKIDWIGR